MYKLKQDFNEPERYHIKFGNKRIGYLVRGYGLDYYSGLFESSIDTLFDLMVFSNHQGSHHSFKAMELFINQLVTAEILVLINPKIKGYTDSLSCYLKGSNLISDFRYEQLLDYEYSSGIGDLVYLLN